MRKRDILETVLGGVVLVVAGLFLFVAYASVDLNPIGDTYEVQARFSNVGGLAARSDVRISGITVGKVVARRLDPDTYEAIVSISLDSSVRLPSDTVAVIASDGLLGGKHLRLELGGEEELIEPGQEILWTQSSPDIDSLISAMVHGGRGGS